MSLCGGGVGIGTSAYTCNVLSDYLVASMHAQASKYQDGKCKEGDEISVSTVN